MKEFCKRYMVAILLGVFLASVALCIVAVETTQYVPGDVNHDGAVDSADVITLRRYLNGDRDLEYQEIALDISNDGTVDETDIDLLRQAIVAGFGVELKPNMPEVPPVEPEEPFDNTQMVARLRMVSGDIKDNELNFVMEESAMMMYTIKVCIDDILQRYDTVGVAEEINKAYLNKYYPTQVATAKDYFMIIKNDAKKKAAFQDEIADMRAGTIRWLLEAFDIDISQITG